MEMHITSKIHGTRIVYFDIDDWNKIKDYGWYVKKEKNTFYVQAYENKHKTISMHRLLLNPVKDKVVDHINHNGLDNRKCNLRICSNAENLKNQIIRTNNKSGYKGVYFNKPAGMFCAQIRINGKLTHIGYFKEAIDAAKEYNNAAILHYGEFARLNVIDNV